MIALALLFLLVISFTCLAFYVKDRFAEVRKRKDIALLESGWRPETWKEVEGEITKVRLLPTTYPGNLKSYAWRAYAAPIGESTETEVNLCTPGGPGNNFHFHEYPFYQNCEMCKTPVKVGTKVYLWRSDSGLVRFKASVPSQDILEWLILNGEDIKPYAPLPA